MLSCLSACRKHNVSCPIVECKLYIPSEQHLNCIQEVECKLYIPSEQHLNCIQEFIDSKAGQINNRAQTNAGVEKKGDLDALCSLQEVGDVFGLTRERIRQVERTALKKLERKLKGLKHDN
jgi:hypothetical protein